MKSIFRRFELFDITPFLYLSLAFSALFAVSLLFKEATRLTREQAQAANTPATGLVTVVLAPPTNSGPVPGGTNSMGRNTDRDNQSRTNRLRFPDQARVDTMS